MKITRHDYKLPPEGKHWATVSGIKDLGMQATSGGEQKPKIRIDFEIDETDNGRAIVASKYCVVSLDPHAALFELIVDLGVEPCCDGGEFETDQLLGLRCQIVIEHRAAEGGRVFANIVAILRDGLTEAEIAQKLQALEEKRTTTRIAQAKAARKREMEQRQTARKQSIVVSAPKTNAADEGPITEADIPF
jgi:hypothetical protein